MQGGGKSHTFIQGANQMKRRDAKWFHLEIYRRGLSFFSPQQIIHINLLSCEVVFEIQKVLKVRHLIQPFS